MRFKSIAALLSAIAIAASASISYAQGPAGYQGYDSEYEHGQQGWSNWGDHDRDNDRNDWNSGRPHWRVGSVSIRNSRPYTVSVQLRDSDGDVRSSFVLSPGERESIRTSASSRWTVTVRQYRYKSYRRYSLDEIGSFENGRWYLRIR
jgi:hypothetical protein